MLQPMTLYVQLLLQFGLGEIRPSTRSYVSISRVAQRWSSFQHVELERASENVIERFTITFRIDEPPLAFSTFMHLSTKLQPSEALKHLPPGIAYGDSQC
jgi:hypothetical protein